MSWKTARRPPFMGNIIPYGNGMVNFQLLAIFPYFAILSASMSFLTTLFGDPNDRYIRSLSPLVDATNAFEPAMQARSDEELKELATEFRKRLADGAALDELLPEAFAAVREASRRVSGKRHFDVQLIGGITLHRGKT